VLQVQAVTDCKKLLDRTHYTVSELGWKEVADDALRWAVEHAAGDDASAMSWHGSCRD
jgi:hypothetical protein